MNILDTYSRTHRLIGLAVGAAVAVSTVGVVALAAHRADSTVATAPAPPSSSVEPVPSTTSGLGPAVAATPASTSATARSDRARQGPPLETTETAPTPTSTEPSGPATSDPPHTEDEGQPDPTGGPLIQLADPEPEPTMAGQVSQHGASMDKPTVPPAQPVETSPSWDEVQLDVIEPPEPAAPTVPDPASIDPIPNAAGGGMFVANAWGCAVNCFTSAQVSHDPKFAKLTVELETTVATTAFLWVSSTAPEVTPPTVAVTDWPDYSNTTAATTWATTTGALLYDTTYWITILVVDQKGDERWAITAYHTMEAPFADDFIAEGSPCHFGCIVDGFVYPGDHYSTVDLVMLTNTAIADYSFAISKQEPGWVGDAPLLPKDVPFAKTQGGVGNHAVRGTVAGLEADTTYHVVASVTDGEGAVQHAVGSFHTAPAPPPPPVPTEVLISFNRVKIVYDGDEGNANRGEIALRWGFYYDPNGEGNGDMSYKGERSKSKLSNDDVVELPSGSGRWISVAPGGQMPLLIANAIEHDPATGDAHHLCTTGLNLETQPLYDDACDERITSAVWQPTLEAIESLPTCATFGYTDWRATHRCVSFMSAEPGADYATFSTVVSFHID